jgi:4-hydroxy-2-oxoheptanedioate aldolase
VSTFADSSRGRPEAPPLRSLLQQERWLAGCTVTIPDAMVVETIADAGFDFLLADCQHTPIGSETLQGLLAVARPTPVLVRPASNSYSEIGRVLDLGVAGVIVPLIQDVASAREALDACFYAPNGSRSWGPRRAAPRWGGTATYEDYRPGTHELRLLQIETAGAVRDLDAILSLPGLDGVVIGPADLALALGYRIGDPAADVIARTVVQECVRRGLIAGYFAGRVANVKPWIEAGCSLVIAANDLALLSGAISDATAVLTALRRAPLVPPP